MRDRGNPPDLEGFEFVELIGQGGFADVFLYEQQMPTRRVAVKVLLASAVDGPGRDQFVAEANVMAQLSGHPSIVPIYQTGTSRDKRPYLVMEYCPPPSLAGRFRVERFEVPEALETMIKISSAVETAHRAGVLHRDIKPHNILTSSFGAPMLTDFGIAGTTGDEAAEVAGLSVPWAPPEAFGETAPVDPRSDVYSLAATLYSLLAGRSPFEVVGAANDNHTLMTRIERQQPPRISRADVSDALHAVLARAMDKQIDRRHPTAMAFARSLQDVQAQLNLAQTRIDVLDAAASHAPVRDTENRTQVRPVQIIVPEEAAGTRLRPIVVPQVRDVPARDFDDRTVVRSTWAPAEPVPDTMAKAGAAISDRTDGSHFLRLPEAAGDAVAPPARSRPPLAVAGALGLGLIVLAVFLVAVAFGGGPEDETPTVVAATAPPGDVDEVVGTSVVAPAVKHSAERRGVRFTWAPESGESADAYLVRTGAALDDLSAVRHVTETSVFVPAGRGDLACIEVTAVVAQTRSQAVRSCEVNR